MAGSKVKKGFMYYLLMFIFTLFGIACVFIAVLIFNPGKDVFGIGLKYVSHTKPINYYNLTDSETKISQSTFNTVVFNSEYTSFNIEYDKDASRTRVKFQPNITALSKEDITDFGISIKITDSKLVIDVTEPKLWIGFSKSATISLVCPENKDFNDYAFDINTTSGSVSIGDTTTHNYNIKDLKIKTETGAVAIYNNVNVLSNNINIETNNSKITINSKVTGTIDITNTKGRIFIDEFAGDVKLTNYGTLEANCTNIGGDVFVKSNNGYLKIENLGITEILNKGQSEKKYGYVDVDASRSDYVIQSYSKGNFTALDNLGNTNLTINNMTGNFTSTSGAGFVNIRQLGGQALIETDSGYVDIGKVRNKLDISTNLGNVTFNQFGNTARTTIDTIKGKINASFAEIGSAKLYTENSNINISVAREKAFKLTYLTKDGLNASWITENLDKNGTILVSGATDSTTNVIEAYAQNGKVDINDNFKK